jgi:hypothetical protein
VPSLEQIFEETLKRYRVKHPGLSDAELGEMIAADHQAGKLPELQLAHMREQLRGNGPVMGTQAEFSKPTLTINSE